MRPPVLALLLLVGLLCASPVCAAGGKPPAQPPGLATGAPAPDFTLRDLQGNPVSLAKLRGKVVFLNFWATWCPPCRAEMPSMERLKEVYDSKDLVILAVNIEEDPAPVRKFVKENGYTFRVLSDAGAEVQQRYGVFRFPETFLIDKQGRVRERYLGERNWSSVEFLQKIGTLLKE